MFRAALHMVISDFKVFIVFIALSVGGGGSTGFQFKLQTQAVEFPQVLLVQTY